MTNFKALCAELVHIANALDGKNALISNQGQAMDGYSALAAFRDVANRARAALAAEADGPAVPEGRDSVYAMKMPTQRQLMLLADEMNLPSVGDAAAYARAVLARWGCHPAPVPPAERSEIARCLADSLKSFRLTQDPADYPADHWSRRAAELLQQQHLTPVPVAERLPSASHVYFEFVISDADDCTQTGGIAPTYAQALSEGQHYLAQYQQDGPHTLELRRVEVLPPGALPLPQGEVMMINEHPITPPPELVEKWIAEIWHEGTPVRVSASDIHIATQAARWGADQELEVCVNYVDNNMSGNKARRLRAIRRPGPLSLKEQAKAELNRLIALISTEGSLSMAEPIRYALEQFDALS